MSGFAWGPLRSLIDDVSVTEIMVTAADRVFATHAAGDDFRTVRTTVTFTSPADLEAFVFALAREAAVELGPETPTADFVAPPGLRLAVTVAPVTDGATLTIRRLADDVIRLADIAADEGFSRAMGEFLTEVTVARVNLLLWGMAGAGKTTMIGAVLDELPPSARVVLVERHRELAVDAERHPSLVRLNAGAKPAGELLRTALRGLGAEVIALSEFADGMASDLVTVASSASGAMVITSVMAPSAEAALARIGSAYLSENSQAEPGDARRLVAASFPLAIGLGLCGDTTRRILSIDEVVGAGVAGGFRLANLFRMVESDTADGRIQIAFDRADEYAMHANLRRRWEQAGLDAERWTGRAARHERPHLRRRRVSQS